MTMQDIYKKALRIARQKVLDDEQYSKIITFCKYKLDNSIYTRHEDVTYFPNGSQAACKVYITSEAATNFTEYRNKKQSNKTIRNYYYI